MRKQNYENFLKEQAAEKTVKTWCAFEESAQTKNSNSVDSTNIKNSGKSKKKKRNGDSETSSSEKTKEKHSDENESSEGNEEEIDKWLNENPDEETETKYTDITTQLENILKSKKTNKKNKSKDNSNSESSFTVTNAIENDDSKIVKKSKKRKCDEASVDDETSNHAEIPKKINKTADAQDVSENKNKKSKNKTKTAIPEELGIENTKNISDNSNESNRNQKKNKKVNNVDESSKIDEKLQSDVTLENAEKNTNKKQKKNKTKNNTAPDEKNESKIVQKLDNKSNMASNNKNKKDFESKRRKPQMEKSILIVNGEQLEVSCFDGFPILTKDAERLQDLRKNLISKGIPRSEVTRTMKLERRKAEKALSRMKKKLCFHCRKGGHNLSECPELTQKSDFGAPSTGICFKCGSTEHTHFACKVVRTQDYKFAQCFICKEQVLFLIIILYLCNCFFSFLTMFFFRNLRGTFLVSVRIILVAYTRKGVGVENVVMSHISKKIVRR